LPFCPTELFAYSMHHLYTLDEESMVLIKSRKTTNKLNNLDMQNYNPQKLESCLLKLT
jgi:hypothetical protein